MKHFGDITKIDGHKVPLVDIVCGGSPCQDLSVAGKRAGLDGERSGLFMEQIRIVKEMRDESLRQLRVRGSDDISRVIPRFMVWENVPGAFSSNRGEDFRVVLEEICRVKDKDASIPMPEGGRWSTSGCIVGDGYSVAWRVHDAQFWGVPQRRKRIALVADFGGQCAPEILFERKSVSGDITESGEQGKDVAANVGIRTKETGKCLNGWDVQSKHIQSEDGTAESLYAGECRYGGGESYVMQSISFQERAGKPGGGKGILIQNDRTGALSTLNNQPVCYGISAYDSNAMKSANPNSGIYKADATRTLDNNGGNPACNQGGMIVLEGNGSRPSHRGDGYKESDVSFTLNSTEVHGVCWDGSQIAPTLTANNAGGAQRMPDKDNFNAVITYGLDRASFNQGKNAQYDFSIQEELAQTIVAKGPGAVMAKR